jgi:hypothetical protein
MRLQIVDDQPVTAAAAVDEEAPPVDEEAPDEAQPDEAPAATTNRFRALMTVEDEWSGDRRQFAADSLTWADLPLPLTGLDKVTEAHQEAVVVGHFDRIERIGNEVWGYGEWATTADAVHIRSLVRGEHLKGVSVDVDSFDWELLITPEMQAEEAAFTEALEAIFDEDGDGEAELPEPETDADGNQVIPMNEPKMRITSGRIVSACIVPMPAFQAGQIWDEDPDSELDAITAAADSPSVALVAAAIPVRPPLDWFAKPSFAGFTPWSVSDDGKVYGHLASWSDCHISFPDQCVPPPRSATSYAHFLQGEIVTDDGVRVPVGQITMGCGHADTHLSAAEAAAHYDNVGTAIADVFAGEDKFGIWIAGALKPDVTPAQVRDAMAAGVSGDWRWVAGNLELVGILNVNVPGFNRANPRVAAYVHGLVAGGAIRSMVVPFNGPGAKAPADPAADRRVRTLIAAAVGRTPAQRRAELRAIVHKES